MEKEKTKKAFIKFLDEIGCPEKDKKSNGGRCPDYVQYGTWLYRNDPIAFNVGYNEFLKNSLIR